VYPSRYLCSTPSEPVAFRVESEDDPPDSPFVAWANAVIAAWMTAYLLCLPLWVLQLRGQKPSEHPSIQACP